MENKGASLNKRVWKLFGEAGFTTKPNTNDSDEHVVNVGSGKTRTVDLLASDTELDVTIVGSNKSGKIDSWTAHVTDFEGIRKAAKASKLLFVVTGKDLTPEDLAFAKARNASVWTAQDLKYYEALVATIGRYAKFEILHNLGVRTKEEDNVVTLIALRTKQPFSDGPCELYTFTMSPENLLKTCVVYRKALDVSGDNAKAYQRMINKQRLPKIAEYVSKRDSILPVNIIVDLKEDVEVTEIDMEQLKTSEGRAVKFKKGNADLVRLSIPLRYASMELIDGQHRLFGFSKSNYPRNCPARS